MGWAGHATHTLGLCNGHHLRGSDELLEGLCRGLMVAHLHLPIWRGQRQGDQRENAEAIQEREGGDQKQAVQGTWRWVARP